MTDKPTNKEFLALPVKKRRELLSQQLKQMCEICKGTGIAGDSDDMNRCDCEYCGGKGYDTTTRLYTGQAPQEPKNPCDGCETGFCTGLEKEECQTLNMFYGKKAMYQSFNLKPVDIKKMAEFIEEHAGFSKAKDVEQAISQYIKAGE
jgi:DnaJ-class molecular chaperone